MSKRCCATNCFNSVQYNRNIAYFSFPKHKDFAQQWAHLAGRNDLLQKPLNSLVKYFLCSEHFNANCFLDKDTKQILKRNLPHSIAMPTIFKNNLQETMQNTNPKHSIEVHNIVLVNVGRAQQIEKNENNDYDSTDSFCERFDSPEEFSESDKQQDDETRLDAVVNENYENQNDIEFPSISLESETFKQCRLCAKSLDAAEPYASFKESFHLREFVKRIMHNQICLNDNLSQEVCKNCENNALLCLLIIQEMDSAQKKINIDSTL